MYDTMTWTTREDGTQTASPSSAFWEAWRADKAAVKANGYAVSKPDGVWRVVYTPPKPIEESRALSADIEIPAPEGLSYFDYQKAGIKFAEERGNTLNAAPPGLGKAQPTTALVYTPSGAKPIGSLAPGDYVIGSSGRPVRVTGVYPRGKLPVYRVTFNDGFCLDVAEDHLWAVRSNVNDDFSVLSTAQLLDEHGRLTREVNAGSGRKRQSSIDTYFLDSEGKGKWMIPMLSAPAEFLPRAVPLEPYIMGLILGDGSYGRFAGGVSFTTTDAALKDSILHYYPDTTSSLQKGVETLRFRYPVRDALDSLGLKGHLAHEKFIPDVYKYNSVEVRLAVLQGLMDTDGSPLKGCSGTEYSTSSTRLCNDVVELVQSLGGVARVRSRIPKYMYRGEQREGRVSYRVNVKLPVGMCPFRMSRKAAVYQPPTKYLPNRYIRNTQRLDMDTEMVCIAVDAPDHLYVTEHFIVTHNTVMTAGVINLHPEFERVLVICPNTLKINWQRELHKWLVKPYTIGVVNRNVYPDTDIVIINYDVAVKHKDKLHAVEWDFMVLDESHAVKNDQTARTKAILGKGKNVPGIRAKKKLFLTGTPILNRPIELFTTLSALDPNEWKSRWSYAHRYCGAVNNGWGWDFSGASNLEELNHRLRSTLMWRVSKEEALPELPPVFHQIVELPQTPEMRNLVRREYKEWESRQEILDTLRAAVEVAKVSNDPEEYKTAVANLKKGMEATFEEMSRIRQELALAKLPYVVEHVKDAEGKVIVFFHHREVGLQLKNLLGSEAVLVMGGVSVEDRQAAVDAFQTDSNVKYFLGSITAAGVGITLTASSHVVFAELDYRPAMINQAYSRAQRIGQKNNVLVQYLLVEDSLDVKMAQTIVDKQEIIAKALDDVVDEVPLPEDRSIKVHPKEYAKVEPVSDEEKQELLMKLRVLAAFDYDHARVQNGLGFNKVDGKIGHSLASCTKLTDKQAHLAKKLVTKYRRQLEE